MWSVDWREEMRVRAEERWEARVEAGSVGRRVGEGRAERVGLEGGRVMRESRSGRSGGWECEVVGGCGWRGKY